MSQKLYPDQGFTSSVAFHKAGQKVDDCLKVISSNKGALTTEHLRAVKGLFKIPEPNSSAGVSRGRDDPAKRYSIDHIHEQYMMVQSVRDQVVNGENRILEGSTIKDLSALISAINSLISLFIKAEERMDRIQEEELMRRAVKEALEVLPNTAKKKFFTRLAELEAEARMG